MADLTPNLKLTLPNEEEYYDIEVFNDNFKKVDEAALRFPRTFISSVEPSDWTEDDVWLQVLDINEKPDIVATLELAAYDPDAKFTTEIDGSLHTIVNAVESEDAANDGDIIIEI